MPFWFVPLITLGIKALATCACVGAGCYACNKVVKAVKGGQKLKRLKYEYSLEEKKLARENNAKLQPQREEKRKEQEKQEKINQQKEKEVEEAKTKSNDPNLSEDEKRY